MPRPGLDGANDLGGFLEEGNVIQCPAESEASMKVLFQLWIVPTLGLVSSISKDMAQYEAIVVKLEAQGSIPEPGDPFEVEIPDGHEFAESVKEETVFLHRDEEGFITFPK